MLDVVQRYAPVIDIVKKCKLKKKEIVEVGGTGEGASFYLPNYKIIDCDIEFVKDILPNVRPVKYKGRKLPLPDNYTDIVISVDMLEHLSNKKRQKEMVKEMLRVAKKTVVLGIPCGKESLAAIRKFGQWFRQKHPNVHYKYLDEHLAYGHPEREEIIQMIKDSGFKTEIRVKKNTNINLWLLFQKTYLTLPKLYLIFRYRKLWYYLLKPIFPFCNFGKTMRLIFHININKNRST